MNKSLSPLPSKESISSHYTHVRKSGIFVCLSLVVIMSLNFKHQDGYHIIVDIVNNTVMSRQPA